MPLLSAKRRKLRLQQKTKDWKNVAGLEKLDFCSDIWMAGSEIGNLKHIYCTAGGEMVWRIFYAKVGIF